MSPHCPPAESSSLCFAEVHFTGRQFVFTWRHEELESISLLWLVNLNCCYLTSEGTCLFSWLSLSAFGLKASLLWLFLLNRLLFSKHAYAPVKSPLNHSVKKICTLWYFPVLLPFFGLFFQIQCQICRKNSSLFLIDANHRSKTISLLLPLCRFFFWYHQGGQVTSLYGSSILTTESTTGCQNCSLIFRIDYLTWLR